MTLHAITIRQAYAMCVATGHKRVENRGRSTSHRGDIAIHAARAHSPAGDVDPRVTSLWGSDPRVGLPVGAVIAVADLTDCHHGAEHGCCAPWGDDWYPTKAGVVRAWHLVLGNVRRLDVPVHVRGQVRVPWLLPDDVEAPVRAQLAAQVSP